MTGTPELERIVLPSGTELDTWISGPDNAPALIFLHGFPENHRTWRHQIAHLQDRYRCIAPDQRGYGNSSRPEKVADYAVPELVGDIFGLAQALGLERFTIVGHDWGGAIAWAIAMMGQANGMVTRAIIANTPHPAVFQRLLYTDAGQRAASQYMRAFRDPAIDTAIRQDGFANVMEGGTLFSSLPPFDPAELAILQEQWAVPERVTAMLNWYRASPLDVPSMDAPMGLPEDFAPSPFMMPLQIPALVVWGIGDSALLPGNLDGLSDWVEHLRIERIPDAGHFVPWEAPAAVNAAMDGFLASTD